MVQDTDFLPRIKHAWGDRGPYCLIVEWDNGEISKIDFSDAPEATNSAKTLVGRFYRPVKQLISLRVDADVLAWFRGRGTKYQTYMNQVLRREMQTRPRG